MRDRGVVVICKSLTLVDCADDDSVALLRFPVERFSQGHLSCLGVNAEVTSRVRVTVNGKPGATIDSLP